MNNINVFPFYGSLEEQYHRREYGFGEKFSLLAPKQTFLPFQIQRPTSAASINEVLLVDFNSGASQDITGDIIANGLSIEAYDDYDIIYYAGLFELSTTIDEGLHYLQISDGTNTWFSELLTLVSDVSNCLKVEYWDGANLDFSGGEIHYQNRFKFRVYLPTDVGYPDYVFEEEATRRDGMFFPEKRIAYKTYKFNFIAPEFLCDALRIAAISDKVYISNKNNTYISDRFLITPAWQDGGFFAAVEAEFEAGTIYKKTGILSGDSSGDFNVAFSNAFSDGFQ